MAALGQIPDPMAGKPVVRLEFARHYIDMIEVLQEKTKGNATEEEAMLGKKCGPPCREGPIPG